MSEGSLDSNRTKLTRIYSDRLGSTRATETIQQYGGGWTTRNYYPFGEEIGTPSANNAYKFASTYRDSATGLDYAVNRYYSSGTGRFLSADPYQASGGPADPQSWNHYAYVQNDPINWRDSSGTNLENPDGSAREGRVPGGGGGLGSYSGYGSEGTSYTYFGPTLGGGVLAPGSGGGGGGGGGLSNAAPMQLDSATSKLLSGALEKEDCWKQLGATSAAAARSALSGANLFAKDLGVVNVAGNGTEGYTFNWQDGETSGGNIIVNYNLFSEPSAKAWTVGEEKMSILDIMAKTGYGQLSDTDYRAMVVIHELSHIMGRPDDQKNPTATKDFNLNTISNCLR
jgi:RHS repeat-associated protein